MEIEYRLPYTIHVDEQKYNMFTRKQMWSWCKEAFGDNRDVWSWGSDQFTLDVFFFNDTKHANLFLLKWA